MLYRGCADDKRWNGLDLSYNGCQWQTYLGWGGRRALWCLCAESNCNNVTAVFLRQNGNMTSSHAQPTGNGILNKAVDDIPSVPVGGDTAQPNTNTTTAASENIGDHGNVGTNYERRDESIIEDSSKAKGGNPLSNNTKNDGDIKWTQNATEHSGSNGGGSWGNPQSPDDSSVSKTTKVTMMDDLEETVTQPNNQKTDNHGGGSESEAAPGDQREAPPSGEATLTSTERSPPQRPPTETPQTLLPREFAQADPIHVDAPVIAPVITTPIPKEISPPIGDNVDNQNGGHTHNKTVENGASQQENGDNQNGGHARNKTVENGASPGDTGDAKESDDYRWLLGVDNQESPFEPIDIRGIDETNTELVRPSVTASSNELDADILPNEPVVSRGQDAPQLLPSASDLDPEVEVTDTGQSSTTVLPVGRINTPEKQFGETTRHPLQETCE